MPGGFAYRVPGPVRHAPWSRWFRTHWLTGSHSHELQVGPIVIQRGYPGYRHGRNGRRWIVWRDPYWRS